MKECSSGSIGHLRDALTCTIVAISNSIFIDEKTMQSLEIHKKSWNKLISRLVREKKIDETISNSFESRRKEGRMITLEVSHNQLYDWFENLNVFEI